jgi:hypothetical protein
VKYIALGGSVGYYKYDYVLEVILVKWWKRELDEGEE